MIGRRAPAVALVAVVAVGAVALAACDDDGAQSAETTTTTLAAPATSAVTATASTAATGAGAGAGGLCPVVQAWSDQSADALETFRLASRGIDEQARRTLYADAFHDQQEVNARFATALAELQLPSDVRTSLDGAVHQVGTIIAGGAADAAALPDAAYAYVAVDDGTLYTGTEKARAVVFQALTDLAHAPRPEVPRACGQRGPLDLSPSATFPP